MRRLLLVLIAVGLALPPVAVAQDEAPTAPEPEPPAARRVREPSVFITSPAAVRVVGPIVNIRVLVDGFELVEHSGADDHADMEGGHSADMNAETEADATADPEPEAEEEADDPGVDQATERPQGHVHLFIDRDPVGPGELIPGAEDLQLVENGKVSVIHMAEEPLRHRAITLEPGLHTVHAVLGTLDHRALDPAAVDSVQFRVIDRSEVKPTDTARGTSDSAFIWGFVPLIIVAVITLFVLGRRRTA